MRLGTGRRLRDTKYGNFRLYYIFDSVVFTTYPLIRRRDSCRSVYERHHQTLSLEIV